MDKDSVDITTNNKTMTPTFSIIIPHKDIPDLLMRCLRSIPVSEDIQVIVVDDNSAGADSYFKKYPEMSRSFWEFIRAPKNGGAGYARNIGLDRAKGKYVLFADADDFFTYCINDILDEYKNESCYGEAGLCNVCVRPVSFKNSIRSWASIQGVLHMGR